MYTNRKAFALLAVPFGAVTIATLLLYFVADQTLEALRTGMRLSDLWMEADRNGALQVDRCLDAGGAHCDLVQVRLKRPMAYTRATRERLKPNPDLRVIREALAEAGVENASMLRFRANWFERFNRLVALKTDNPISEANQAAPGNGEYTADVLRLLTLNARAKQAHAKVPVDSQEVNAIRRELNEFRAAIEARKSEFDVKSAATSDRLRQTLYLGIATSVLGMFTIASLISRAILKRWAAKEAEFRARDQELSTALQQRVSDLQAAVAEKGILLRELQHRVKNNLQVVASLSSLQARCMSEGPAKQALITIQDRVKSLALVHESLCFSDSLAEVDFARYIHILVPHLVASYASQARAIQVHIEANAVVGLDDATPCALILNELVSNALKYAFPPPRTGNLWIRFVRQDQQFLLEVRDDGIGMPPGFSIEKADSLGLQLVSDLTEQLHGVLTWTNEGGAAFRLRFQQQSAGQGGRQNAA